MIDVLLEQVIWRTQDGAGPKTQLAIDMKRSKFISALVALCATSLVSAQLNLYVATNGNDSWSGTLPEPNATGTDGPFRTLQQVNNKFAFMWRNGGVPHPVTTYVREGVYRLPAPWVINSEMVGTSQNPTVFRNYPGETPVLRGSVPVTNWTALNDFAAFNAVPVGARPFVKQSNLVELGLTDYGTLVNRGAPNLFLNGPMELYDFQQPCRRAKYPNTNLPYLVSTNQGANFIEADGLGARMANWNYNSDMWVHGYLGFDWSDRRLKIASIDASTSTLQLAGTSVHGYKPDIRFRVENVLEELDQPGEYYIDRQRGLIFYYPLSKTGQIEAELSVNQNTVMSLIQTRNVLVKGFVLEQAWQGGITSSGSERIKVEGCTIRNAGGLGIFARGTNLEFRSCDIYNTGSLGISLIGGDRPSLTASGNSLINCNFFNNGITDLAFSSAIRLEGVGHLVRGCSVSENQHIGIYLVGNDHIIENSEIYNCAKDTSDASAVYIGRDWTMRGNQLRNNWFHHIYDRIESIYSGRRTDIWAMYMDDGASGTLVKGNLFSEVSTAWNLGGGRDNICENNIIYNERFVPQIAPPENTTGFNADGRFTSSTFQPMFQDLLVRLAAMPYQNALWTARYPKLATILNEAPEEPRGHIIRKNIYVGKTGYDVNRDEIVWWYLNTDINRDILNITDNVAMNTNPGFNAPERRDFRILPGTPASTIGFTPLNTKQMGLYRDDLRFGRLIHPNH